MEKINLQQKLSLFSEHWTPKIVEELNDYQIKLVKIEGEFVWHDHADTDEFFLVIEGEMEIEFEDHTMSLKAGEMCVVPKGVRHKPKAEHECKVMLIEPRGVWSILERQRANLLLKMMFGFRPVNTQLARARPHGGMFKC